MSIVEILTSSVISEVIWDGIKNGVKISTDFLKHRLSKWLLDDDAINTISQAVYNAPDQFLKSQKFLDAYLDGLEEIQTILEKANSHSISIQQNIDTNNGLSLGYINGDFIYHSNLPSDRNIEGEAPKKISGHLYSILDNYTGNIQSLKSYTNKRKNIMIQNNESSIGFTSDIDFSDLPPSNQEVQFIMLLIKFIPGENWLTFSQSNFSLEFETNASKTLHQFNLEIKNSLQQAFVNTTITVSESVSHISYPLLKLASESSWKDIGEICFTIPFDSDYLQGTIAQLNIMNLQLIKS